MGSKYQTLRAALQEAAQQGRQAMEFSFAEIDAIVDGLPPSARTHRPWWANGGHSQSQAWRSIGWRVEMVDLGLEMVRFVYDPAEGVRAHDEPAADEMSPPAVRGSSIAHIRRARCLPCLPSS